VGGKISLIFSREKGINENRTELITQRKDLLEGTRRLEGKTRGELPIPPGRCALLRRKRRAGRRGHRFTLVRKGKENEKEKGNEKSQGRGDERGMPGRSKDNWKKRKRRKGE